ncbi:MAG: sugar transferase [Planctomycetota bacterium]|nr:MAG: sugar transferase [Planctomycetota bacterium]
MTTLPSPETTTSALSAPREHSTEQPISAAIPVCIPDSRDPQSLSDLFDYASPEQLPAVPWLSQLSHQDSRVDLHSLESATRIAKRIVDIVLATIMLIVLSPVMLFTALLVKLTSPGPVIFKQTRVGLNLRRPGAERREIEGDAPEGVERRVPESDRRREFAYGRHFRLYKFRSMRNDAEKNGAQFATKGDARVTPLGRFMRKTRLDELPQLWNVIRGDMSLVGPRPERPEFIQDLSKEIPDYLQRLGLKPGLTGVAQIVNGYDNNIESFRRKVAFDLMYLRNCCLWNDLKILFRTIRVVLSGSGAL